MKQLIDFLHQVHPLELYSEQVDIQKFAVNFTRKYTKMKQIQERFMYITKQKITTNFRKIPSLLKEHIKQSQKQLTPKKIASEFNSNTVSLATKSQNRFAQISEYKSSANKNKMPVQDKEIVQNLKANNNSMQTSHFTIDFQNGRPKTSMGYPSASRKISSKSVKFDLQNNERTFSINKQHSIEKNNASQRKHKSKNIINVTFGKFQSLQMNSERKTFYDELEDFSKPQQFCQSRIKIPKKNKLHSQRWSFKAKQLL